MAFTGFGMTGCENQSRDWTGMWTCHILNDVLLSLLYRSCIRPEVSRTKTVGKKGVSNGAYFTKHLQYIVLNANPVDFTQRNLTYLKKVSIDSMTLVELPAKGAGLCIGVDTASSIMIK